MDVIEHARQLRIQIEELAVVLNDTTALDNKELFPMWAEDKSYEVDFRVRYNGILYKCLQAHISQSTWNPKDAPSLWARVLIPDPEVIPGWIQPDSTNPYMMGDKVTHNGKTWISIVDNNVWEPGVYGWDEITDNSETSTETPTNTPTETPSETPSDTPTETISEWTQPDSTNPYMIGDKVTHNGKTWTCNTDNNVWEPGVYGWDEVTE